MSHACHAPTVGPCVVERWDDRSQVTRGTGHPESNPLLPFAGSRSNMNDQATKACPATPPQLSTTQLPNIVHCTSTDRDQVAGTTHNNLNQETQHCCSLQIPRCSLESQVNKTMPQFRRVSANWGRCLKPRRSWSPSSPLSSTPRPTLASSSPSRQSSCTR